jgi:uncharacterized membrane protein YtjA (UPF0391 family)
VRRGRFVDVWNPVRNQYAVGSVLLATMRRIDPGSSPQEDIMLRWALIFFIVAVVAAVFGFGGIAAGAASIAQILFFLFLVLFVVALIASLMRGGRPPAV